MSKIVVPNGVDNSSLEVLRSVDELYSKSFKQLEVFYDQSFDKLLATLGIVGFVVGGVAPLLIWFFTKRVLNQDYKKLKSDTEKRIGELESLYQQKLSKELKNFHNKVGEIESKLKKEMYLLQGRGFSIQAASLPSIKERFIVESLAVELLIKAEHDESLSLSLDRLLELISGLACKDDKNFVFTGTTKILKDLKKYNKKREGCYASIIGKLEKKLQNK